MQEEFFMNSMEKDPKLSGEHGAQTRKSLALKARGDPRTRIWKQW